MDVVDEMLDACAKNLVEAEQKNAWFDSSFVDLRKGDAMHLPVEDESIDVAAQNCLFNIFEKEAKKHNVRFLVQGTIAPDWIEKHYFHTIT